MNNKKELIPAGTVVLLSGGLDSLVTLANSIRNTGRIVGLFFDYGQIALEAEHKAASAQALHYDIELECVKLPFLPAWSNGALFGGAAMPEPDNLDGADAAASAAGVWVPARNAVMLSIAACYAEAKGFGFIAMGFNREEGATFSDNSSEFARTADKFVMLGTNNKVRLLAPLLNLTKTEIVESGISLLAPLHLVWSCYRGDDLMCGVCESCRRLKRALKANSAASPVSLQFKR